MVAVGNGQRWVSWMVGMVVVGRQPLFVVDHAQSERRCLLTFALGMAIRQQVLVKYADTLLTVI